jgi:hypothetical protein
MIDASNGLRRGVASAMAWVVLPLLLASCTRAPEEKLSFNESIQPILSENCYGCHGPDSGSRKAELRLDRAQFVYQPHGKFGPAIVPGKPDESPLVQRIEAKDPQERMPPPEAHKSLDAQQVALLRRWVQQGAEYEQHWAFIAPEKPAPPRSAAGDAWASNDIDRFIFSRAQAEGLAPSAEADKRSLIRRVTYDLTGLPPTPQEVVAFVNDASPQAYEQVVDRLLASPRYGEHRARYWLDVARYGDTHGIHLDNFRSIWPYRDYVIQAFNDNEPFDRFVREQLAGDLLPARSAEQIVATGFIRAGISTGEGGTISEELRVNNKRERAETYGAAFLGLTVGCANCHDHKFDPLTQKEFFQLTAFFGNLAENPSNDDREDWPPYMRVPTAANRAAYDHVLEQRSEVQRQIEARRAEAPKILTAWLDDKDARPQPVPAEALLVRLRFDEQKGATFANTAPAASVKAFSAHSGQAFWGEGTWLWPYMRLDVGTKLEIPDDAVRDAGKQLSVGTWLRPYLRPLEQNLQPTGVIVAKADAAQAMRGWQLRAHEGRLVFIVASRWPDDALEVQSTKPLLAEGRWNHVAATYDGSGKASGVSLFLDGQPVPLKIKKDRLRGDSDSAAPLSFGRVHPDANPLQQSAYQDFRWYARVLPASEVQRLPREDYVSELTQKPYASWTDDQRQVVSDFYFTERDEKTRALAISLTAFDARLNELSKDGAITLVSKEAPGLAYADVLTRGVYTDRKERVRPATPHFLPPLPTDLPRDRRALAEWTVARTNPLTARVTVNRMWSELFGTGIVETTENFGTVGARPTHPHLLDWLAVDFQEHGWDVKRFYKQVVMSATYRQSASATPEQLEKDPRNRFLARGPRFRMDAEMLRDTALATSGLLVERVGGPSVRPYQPPGIWDGGHQSSNTRVYVQDHGSALYRRSLYTFWKRMATLPNMDTFDAPVRDVSCTRRQRSNTPLQALVMMNDVQWMEAARKLAERTIQQAPDTPARLDFLGQTLLARSWSAQEQTILDRMLEEFEKTYRADTAAAKALTHVGESKSTARAAPADLAAWTALASAAMNLDAAINK